MYIPDAFREDDVEKLVAFMKFPRGGNPLPSWSGRSHRRLQSPVLQDEPIYFSGYTLPFMKVSNFRHAAYNPHPTQNQLRNDQVISSNG